jgi:hypothetical protein
VWAGDCRSAAEQFILLGRRIESQKRIPRNQRGESGIKFSNAASMRFEELRSQVPSIPKYVMKRYSFVHTQQSTPALKIPIQLLEYHEQEVGPLGGPRDKLEEVVVDDPPIIVAARKESNNQEEMIAKEKQEVEKEPTPPTPNHIQRGGGGGGGGEERVRPSIQSIFRQRLQIVQQRQEEQDELGQYEEYVRQQYLASTSPIVDVLHFGQLETPRVVSPRKMSLSRGLASPRK